MLVGRVLGVRVHAVTQAQAMAQVEAALDGGGSLHVATVNPEFIMAAQRDQAFRAVLDEVDLAVPDGVGLVVAGRLLGLPLPERVAGVDLVESIAERAARRGWRLFFLGARPGVALAAAEQLRRRYPGLLVAGAFAGSPRPEEEEAILEQVRMARADVLLVAFGAPAQDLWLRRVRGRHPARVAIGVGGAFDFISGRAQRAPRWLRRLGLEWLHRLYREPWRWRRQLALPRFAALVALQRLRCRRGATAPPQAEGL